MLFFWCAEQKNLSAQYKLLLPYGASFAALWHKFCCLMAQVLPQYKLLPPYGASFAALWPSTNKQSAVQNPGSKFWGWGVCVCKSLS